MRTLFSSLLFLFPLSALAGIAPVKLSGQSSPSFRLHIECDNGFEIKLKHPRMVNGPILQASVKQPSGKPYDTPIEVLLETGSIQIVGIFHPYCHQSLLEGNSWDTWSLEQTCEGKNFPSVRCKINQ